MSPGAPIEPCTLTLNVTELVDFSARTGDLYPESEGSVTAQEGIETHKHVQQQRDAQWLSEIPVKHTLDVWVEDQPWRVTLHGRLDLLNPEVTPIVIEEIKTSWSSLESLPAGKQALYWAQAQVYAALYAWQHPERVAPQASITLKLTLISPDLRQTYSTQRTYAVSEAQTQTHHFLQTYLHWQQRVRQRRAAHRQSASALTFPFSDYRPGQRGLAVYYYRAIREKTPLLAEAPTGTGKTLTALFPAIKAFGENVCTQLVYLTAKNSNQRQVEKTVGLLQDRGLALDMLCLTGKDKLCPCRTASSSSPPEEPCAYTLGFWDRLPAARDQCWQTNRLDRENLLAVAHQHRVCPSALSLHLVPWWTLVVADYNYFFDPLARLHGFTHNPAERVLLMDEIHNLPERARRMYSARLHSQTLSEISATHGGDIGKQCQRIQRLLQRLAHQQTQRQANQWTALPDNVLEQLNTLLALLQRPAAPPEPQGDLLDLSSHLVIPQGDLLTPEADSWPSQQNPASRQNDSTQSTSDKESDSSLSIYRFCTIAQLFGDGHICQMSGAGKNVEVRLLCLDPAPTLRTLSEKTTTIGFSATLTPLAFYQTTLGFPAETQCLQLPYAFPVENLNVIQCQYIDTRWPQRQNSLPHLLALIDATQQARPGKYLVFLPSYDYLRMTFEAFAQAYPHHATTCQMPNSSHKAQEAFLHRFFADDQPTIGFAILGGVYAEGVDYAGDALHGAIIVGTGMPQPSEEQQWIAQHFQKNGLNPYQYAYQFPGLSRVLQTAGRVIRSEEDRGVVILVEPRFARPDYRALMPAHWKIHLSQTLADVQQSLQTFWKARANV